MFSAGLEMRQNRFGRGFAAYPTGGAYSASSYPLSGGESAGRPSPRTLPGIGPSFLGLRPYRPRCLVPKHPKNKSQLRPCNIAISNTVQLYEKSHLKACSRWMVFEVTQGHRQGPYVQATFHFLLAVYSDWQRLYLAPFRDITTFIACMTAYNLKKPFIIDMCYL